MGDDGYDLPRMWEGDDPNEMQIDLRVWVL